MKRLKLVQIIHDNIKEIFLALISGILLFLAFPDQNFYLLEWIAFLPLFFAIRGAGYKKTYYLALLTGTVFVCLSYTWIPFLFQKFVGIPAPLNYFCLFLYGFYNAQLFGLIFVLFKFFKNKTKIPQIIIFPFVLVTVWSFFPNLFYFTMSNGASKFLLALQATEYTGTYGLDFIIALFNVTVYEVLKRDFSKSKITIITLSSVIIAVWFSYGFYSLDKWDNEIATWEKKKIGIIQPNRESSFTELLTEEGETIARPFEIDHYNKLSKSNPAFIVWPEGKYRAYLNNQEVHDSYNSFVKDKKIPLIFHDLPIISQNNRTVYRNSTILIGKNGEFKSIYHKKKLVPFGEYIPVLNWFYGLSMKLGMPSVTAGEKNRVFMINGMKIQPLICYEVQFSRFVGQTVGDAIGKLVVVQSNDGWYGKGPQPEQHSASNSLRAVENRVPLIHVINNGKSSVVMPNGRIIYQSKRWERVSDIVEVPYNINKGGSFFSKNPELFISIIRILTIIAGLMLLYRIKFKKTV